MVFFCSRHGKRKEQKKISVHTRIAATLRAPARECGRRIGDPACTPATNQYTQAVQCFFPETLDLSFCTTSTARPTNVSIHDDIDVEVHTCSPSLGYRPTQLNHADPKFEQTGRGFACTILYCRLDPDLDFIFCLIFACLSVFPQGPMCAEAGLYAAFPFLLWRNISGAVDHPYVSDDDNVDDCLYQVLHEL
jgi:hypothetical protein